MLTAIYTKKKIVRDNTAWRDILSQEVGNPRAPHAPYETRINGRSTSSSSP